MAHPSMTIHTVTMNPVIDQIYQVGSFVKGSTFRCDAFLEIPAGKGLNVSYALAQMGVRSHAYIALGREDEPDYRQECRKYDLDLRAYTGEFRVRRHCTILETEQHTVTHIQTQGVKIPQYCLEELRDDVCRRANMNDIVVMSGSLPPGAELNLYEQIILKTKKNGTIAILDSSGDALRLGLQAKPFAVKINEDEAEEITGKRAESNQDEYAILQSLQRETGVKLAVVTLGGRGMIAGSEEGVWRMNATMDPAEIKDTVGCGDSLMAGLIYGIVNNMSTMDCLRQAVAFATASAMQVGPARLQPHRVNALLHRIQVHRLGTL